MGCDFVRYVNEFLDKPNQATGRAFWYDEEVAAATGESVAKIAEYRAFAQNVAMMVAPAKPTLDQYITAWKSKPATSGTKPPVVQSSGQRKKVGDMYVDELEGMFKKYCVK